jgi:hypothetical protein
MMPVLTSMLSAVAALATSATMACSIVIHAWIRYPKAEALVLRALADTAAIDVDLGGTKYVPEWEESGSRDTPWLRRLFQRRPMTAREFKQMSDAWPTIDQWREDPRPPGVW